MTLAPVPLIPAALRHALRRRGMDPVRADAAACGLTPLAITVDDLSSAERDAVVLAAHEQGIACLTGDGWVLLAGHIAQLAGLARPGRMCLDDALADALGRSLSGFAESPDVLETARGSIALEAPVLVGIINVTPDSFSDGGKFLEPDAAVCHAESLIAAGAGMLDVGAESTRPGQPEPVGANEEWRRLEPVLRQLVLRFPDTPLGVDTVRGETARRALDAGVWVINDVSGLRLDPEIATVCAAAGAGLVLMHSRGPFRSMASYDHATYDNLVGEVLAELREAVATAEERGVAPERIVVDPGLGFAKRPEQNLEILQQLAAFGTLGRPVMVGPSRKRFLGAITSREVPHDRDAATAAACAVAYANGARLFRVHNVAAVKDALDVSYAIGSA